jgi:hypothetical protein
MLLTMTHLHLPTLRREGISWRTAGGLVEIHIDLANESDEPTDAGELVVEAAPLGAFVPFKPVTRIAAPGLGPRERRRVTAMVPLESLEDFDYAGFSRLLSSTQWAGNLNVYFDRAPESAVEVHRAFDLKVMAGKPVSFAFLLEHGPRYSMEVNSSDAAWTAEVHPFAPLCALLVVNPPAQAGLAATIEVLVTRDMDGRVVPVEFGLKTTEVESDTLGCVEA